MSVKKNEKNMIDLGSVYAKYLSWVQHTIHSGNQGARGLGMERANEDKDMILRWAVNSNRGVHSK